MKELIESFPNGLELYKKSAVFNKIIHAVYNGMDIKEAISTMAVIIEEQNKQISNLIDRLPPEPIILKGHA